MAKAEVRFRRKSNSGGVAGVLKRTQNAALKVGLLKGLGAHPNGEGVTIPEIGSFHEFGTGIIPERSFLRSTLRERVNVYNELRRHLLAQIILGKMKVEKAIAILGELVKSDVQKTITDISDPPNSEETIARKGSSNPLIDTGLMRQSINWEKL